jgi:hypothetical protein
MATSLSSTSTKPSTTPSITAGTPTFTNVDPSGTGGGTSGGTQVTVDGANVSTLDVSSTPVVQTLYVGADVTATPAAGTTVSDLSQLQTSLATGAYMVEALLYFSMSATGGGTMRFGFGGAGSGGATMARAMATQVTNTSTNTMLGGVLTSLATAGTTATANGNVFGISPGVTTPVPILLKTRILVTSAGTLGVTWSTSNGATATPTLNAGSYVQFTKVA